MGCLVLSRRIGEKVMIGDDIEIVLLGVNGNTARLGIKANPDTLILREELIGRERKEKHSEN